MDLRTSFYLWSCYSSLKYFPVRVVKSYTYVPGSFVLALRYMKTTVLHHLQSVTEGNEPLERPLLYSVNYNGSVINVTSPKTYAMFTAPAVPEPYYVANVTVTVTAINRFGAGPPSEAVSYEISKLCVTYVVYVKFSFSSTCICTCCELHTLFVYSGIFSD